MNSCAPRRAWEAYAFWLVLLGFFCWFARGGLAAHFSPDDMQSIHTFWNLEWSGVFKANVMYFSTVVRPMGAFYFYTLYSLFGLDVFPYRVVALVLATANIGLFYFAARAITRDRWTAAAAVALGAVHPGLILIYYSNAVIYDILCFTFYYSAFVVYAAVRNREEPVSRRRLAVICALYICALNAKEMGVTLPLILGAYEMMRPTRRLRPIILLSAITLIYIAGKRFGADSLFLIDAYRPVWSVERYFDTTKTFLTALFHMRLEFTALMSAAFYALIAAHVVISRSKPLRLAALIAIGGFLPVNFIPPRESFVLYIPFLGWAVYGALSLRQLLRPEGRGFVVAAFCLSAILNIPDRNRWPDPIGAQERTWTVLQEMKRNSPPARPGACVQFVDEPFHPFWDMYFIARLHYNDRSMRFSLTQPAAEPRGDPCSPPAYRVFFNGHRIERWEESR